MELRQAGVDVNIIDGQHVGGRMGGEFLDPTATWIWKGSQVSNLAKCWGNIKDGDWILNLDGWGPASTAAAYMRDTTQRKVRLALYMHAGSYDPTDFLARVGCRKWALDIERGWMNASDIVFVATNFHARLLRDNLGMSHIPVIVCGQPIHQEEIVKRIAFKLWEDRDVVVFPHRLAQEKCPEEFDQIRLLHEQKYSQSHKRTRWIRTRDVYTDKQSYYDILAQAKCAISTARQETFGIAMQEAAALGVWLVAPNRLSYPEVVGTAGFLYNTLEEAADFVDVALSKRDPAPWSGIHENVIHCVGEILR